MKVNYVATSLDKLNEDHVKVMVVGKVIEKGTDYIMLDDSTSTVKVMFNQDNLNNFSNIEVGDNLLVLGKVIKVNTEFVIFVDIYRLDNDINIKEFIKTLDVE